MIDPWLVHPYVGLPTLDPLAPFPPFVIWDLQLEHLGRVEVEGRLPARDGTRHRAEGVRVSDERRRGVFHVYVLDALEADGERVVVGRRFDRDEPQLMTPRTDGPSFRLTAGVKPEADGCSMLFRVAGPWRGEGEGWTAVGGDRAEEALATVGGTTGLLALLAKVPDSGTPTLSAGAGGTRILFESASMTGPVAFWCMSRLMPIVTHGRATGLLPETS